MHEHGLTHALALIEQAHTALAEAASVIRQTNDYDKLAYAAMRLVLRESRALSNCSAESVIWGS